MARRSQVRCVVRFRSPVDESTSVPRGTSLGLPPPNVPGVVMTIRVLVGEDNYLAREGIAAVLERARDV